MADGLVLLHGFTHTGSSWRRVVAALGERYRPQTPDLRGHGGASAARPVSLTAVLGDLAVSAPQRFTLVGYSMGGRIALHMALAQPDRVARLILIGAGPGLANPQERTARHGADAALAAEIEQSTIEAFAHRWAQTPVLAGLLPAVAQEAQADRMRCTPAGLAAALRGLGTGTLPSLWDRLGELSLPVTLVVGERDEKFRAIAAKMAGEMPAPDLVVVAGAGHAVHLEAPEVLAALIGRHGPGATDR